MGKRSAVVELLLGNMGSMQRETRPSMQREDQPTMATKLEQIAVIARREPNLRFTSLAHHITRERVLKNLQQIPKHSAAGVDGQTVEGAKENFEEWIGPCSNPSTGKCMRHQTFAAYISPSPGRRKSVPLGCQPYRTGLSSAARPRCCPPFMSRTFYPAHSAADLGWGPIVPWQPSMRSLLVA